MEKIKKFEQHNTDDGFPETYYDPVASYKRTNQGPTKGFFKFYSVNKLSPATPKNLKKREDAINRVKENILASIEVIENMPVTDWLEDNLKLLDKFYELKDILKIKKKIR